ncbi:hypothetical protein [Nocardiopsis sp. NPDC006832]|uniref:hypothetical protein n=1 Tax=Nocardiopsis sp. NPDC006832 TaxID=3157188 RepID=UPI00341000BE
MSSTPLFSTYRQGENRVTSSMLAVFERIGLSLVEEILAKASGEATLETVTFTNQPKANKGSVPDTRISADFTYLFEVMTVRGTVDAQQLESHLENLEEGPGRHLFVLTPDPERPAAVEVVRDRRVVWFNFAALDDAIWCSRSWAAAKGFVDRCRTPAGPWPRSTPRAVTTPCPGPRSATCAPARATPTRAR